MTKTQHSMHLEAASNRLHGLVLEWLDREIKGIEMTHLEAIYCLQQAQNQLIKIGLRAEREES